MNSSGVAAPLRVGLIAGEASGDTLGAALIEALRRLDPAAQFFGVAGPKMRAAGCAPLADAHELAVMGLFEVLPHLPRLLRLRARLLRDIASGRQTTGDTTTLEDFGVLAKLREEEE